MKKTILIICSILFAFAGVIKANNDSKQPTQDLKEGYSQTCTPKKLNDLKKRQVTMYKIEGRGERAEITSSVEGIFYYEYNSLEECEEGYVIELKDGKETEKRHSVWKNRRSTGVASGFKYCTNYQYFFN